MHINTHPQKKRIAVIHPNVRDSEGHIFVVFDGFLNVVCLTIVFACLLVRFSFSFTDLTVLLNNRCVELKLERERERVN